MTVSCYIYYRVATDRVPEASTAARDIIEWISQRTGIDGQLMTKVGEPLLWMEVYEEIADEAAFLEAMQACVELSDIGRWLDGDGRRHSEIFQAALLRPQALPTGVR